jgi:hypothetical protein
MDYKEISIPKSLPLYNFSLGYYGIGIIELPITH